MCWVYKAVSLLLEEVHGLFWSSVGLTRAGWNRWLGLLRTWGNFALHELFVFWFCIADLFGSALQNVVNETHICNIPPKHQILTATAYMCASEFLTENLHESWKKKTQRLSLNETVFVKEWRKSDQEHFRMLNWVKNETLYFILDNFPSTRISLYYNVAAVGLNTTILVGDLDSYSPFIYITVSVTINTAKVVFGDCFPLIACVKRRDKHTTYQ